MSYFLVIVLDSTVLNCTAHFTEPVILTRVYNSSIIEALGSGRLSVDTYFATMHGDSHELVDKGEPKRNCGTAFINGVQSILNQTKSVSVLLHWFRGAIDSENLPLCPKKKISLSDFIRLYPNIEEDVRYVVVP